MKVRIVIGLWCIQTVVALLPDDPAIRYIGRHHANAKEASFDWVASGFQLQVESSELIECDADQNITAELAGSADLAVLVGSSVYTFSTSPVVTVHTLASAASIVKAGGRITVLKTTEPFVSDHVALFRISLPDCVQPAIVAPSTDELRLDFYGDSDTAAYGVDGSDQHPVKCLEHSGRQFENFLHGWVWNLKSLISRPLDMRVQAVSGIGVVRNAVWLATPTLSTQTLPEILLRTLQTTQVDDYDPGAWKPSAVLIYVGSNDYVNLFSPSRDVFSSKYAAMVAKILAQYPPPAPPVLHICGGDPEPCAYIQAVANQTGGHYTNTFDGGEPTLGCIGHRSASQQKALAARLAPIIVNLPLAGEAVSIESQGASLELGQKMFV
eukprot:TRINITY_DN57767_c0_g1_i1.p1 TRINITY_DN57767_c0_g1~~TRINITY_DN57767_c0_g1_i1.p1  ORF type:complete len:382 (-),score=26.69 TRINITY_DN57767_c0_g1_i1:29-1174(-)